MKRKIGFIGVGIMGKPMATNLIKSGYQLIIHDKNPKPVEELINLGAKKANTPKEVAQKSEIVITMLPDSLDAEKVILAPRGVIEGVREKMIVIDMSSIDPIVSIKIGKRLSEKKVEMLDAPVSGGEEGAIEAILSIMVGGNKNTFKECLDIFQVMGKNIVYTGKLGSGEMTKLLNQIIVALNIISISEAFALGAKAEMPPEIVYNAIRGGLAGSTVLDTKIPRITDRNFEPGFKIDLHIKDLKNALSVAKSLGVYLPFTSLAQQVMIALSAAGKGGKDHSVIINFWEKITGVEVKERKETSEN